QAREADLDAREQALAGAEQALRQRLTDLARSREYVEAARARLVVQSAMWQAERERSLGELRAGEAAGEERLTALRHLRERWDERRQRQVIRLETQRAACAELRRQCLSARDEWNRRSSALVQEQRVLAERALAVEQYRQELIGKSAEPAA